MWNIVSNGGTGQIWFPWQSQRVRVSVHRHRSLTKIPKIPANWSLIGWECLEAGSEWEWMGDQTGLLSAERWIERVDRDGWIEENMKEQDWSELGRGQAQGLPNRVYQRILCFFFFSFFTFLISLTPAQYKAGCFLLKYRQNLSKPISFFLIYHTFYLLPAFVAFPTQTTPL